MNNREILEKLVKIGNQFRNTPIVDDDFPAYRNEFDNTLKDAERHLKKHCPTIVCLCGSTRFSDEFRRQNLLLTCEGKIVLSIGCDTKDDNALFGKLSEYGKSEMKKRLDELHLRKIDLADEILVLNVDGYIGESTSREIEYAKSKNKKIKYLAD